MDERRTCRDHCHPGTAIIGIGCSSASWSRRAPVFTGRCRRQLKREATPADAAGMAELSKVLDDLYGEAATVETPRATPGTETDTPTDAPTASIGTVSTVRPEDVAAPADPPTATDPARNEPADGDLADGDLADGDLPVAEPAETELRVRSGGVDPEPAGHDRPTDGVVKGGKTDAGAPVGGVRPRRRTRAVARAPRGVPDHAGAPEVDLSAGVPLTSTFGPTPWTLSDDDILPLRRRLPGRR
jgi:hypothetical protein